ncbi:MAG: DNA-binding protein [Methylocystaceae bacterium]|nr:DNA-binding protein [Methylocystaceae bacterium]
MSQNIATTNETPSTPHAKERRGYSVAEACELLGCSESHGWKMLRDGQLKGVSLGRRKIIPANEIDRVLEGGAR